MFGFGKKKQDEGLSSNLQKFLEEADKCYVSAFQIRSIAVLKNHFSRECALAMLSWINAEASSRLLLHDKVRKTEWVIQSEDNVSLKILKSCVYREVRLTMSKTMKMSDDYQEIWTVDNTNGYMVTSIQTVEGGF